MTTLGGQNFFIHGFYFMPTDEDLIKEYLLKKFTGGEFYPNVIEEYDVYSTEPWNLPRNLMHSKDGKVYYFSEAKRSNPGSSRLSRQAGDGHWHMNGVTKKIHDQGNNLGNTTTLNYLYGPTKRKTRWIMHEYRINPAFLDNSKSTELVLCSIQESGRGEETSSIIRGGGGSSSSHLLKEKEPEQPVARVIEPYVSNMESMEPNFINAPTTTTANITSTWENDARAIPMLDYPIHHHQQQQQQNADAFGGFEEFMTPEWLSKMDQQDLFDSTSFPFDGLDEIDHHPLFPSSQGS